MAGKKAQPKASEPVSNNQMRRLVPPLAFLVALCLMVVCFYDSGYTSLPPTGKRYDLAKASIETLRQDEKRSGQREPWENLAAEFRAIYDADPGWPNRPAALFRAAESLEELARRSFAKADARKAIECYESVAQRHADSRLADDALFRAAKLRAAWLKDDKGALALLERIKAQYPKGDMLGEALALEKTLQAAANGRTAPEARQVSSTDGKEPKDDTALAKGTSPPSTSDAPQAASIANGDTAPAQIAKVTALKSLSQSELLPRYREAKAKMEALRTDKVRSCWRQPWEELTSEFLRIYTSRKDWAISPGALFRAAASQEALSDCSHMADEYRQARDLYLNLAQEFPKSALADDSLLRAAYIDADHLNQTGEALELLDAIQALYSGGDMMAEAQTLRSRLTGAPATPTTVVAESKPVPPVVQALTWTSLSKDSVEIVLELSAPARYTAKLNNGGVRGKKRKAQASLSLSLANATVEKDIRKGVNIRGSLFKGMTVSDGKDGTAVLQFNFQDARRFDAHTETNPCRIILRVAGGSAQLPPVTNGRAGFAEAQPEASSPASQGTTNSTSTPPAPSLVRDMARQLGLTVRTVFIDAGHGGRDPGTNHKGVLERVISLDVALTLGRLLEANGLDVVYSRTGDKYVSLQQRTTMANAAGADLFVSIHVNANEDSSVQGFETYYLDIASNPEAARLATLENADGDHRLGDMQKMLADVMLNARVDESRHLAQDIQRLSQFRLKRRQFDTKDNGIKSAPFIVLLGAQMPAVLVEIGYCTNQQEASRLLSPKYRMTVAEGLAEGILAYKDRLLKRRTVQNSLTQESAGAM